MPIKLAARYDPVRGGLTTLVAFILKSYIPLAPAAALRDPGSQANGPGYERVAPMVVLKALKSSMAILGCGTHTQVLRRKGLGVPGWGAGLGCLGRMSTSLDQ